jgi:Crinkler effector protein N-terminal domain
VACLLYYFLTSAVTRPSPYSEAQEVLELNCLVLGDSANNTFPVKIARTESVGTLKKSIKTEKSPVFDHIPADQLHLWKVSIPFGRNIQETIHELGLTDEGSLLPVDELSEIFVDLPSRRHLHIVVRRPGESEPLPVLVIILTIHAPILFSIWFLPFILYRVSSR